MAMAVSESSVWSVWGRSPYTAARGFHVYVAAGSRAQAIEAVAAWLDDTPGAGTHVVLPKAGSLQAVEDVKPVRSVPRDGLFLAWHP